MDGRSRVLSDVSETELLDDERFEDALDTFSEQAVSGTPKSDFSVKVDDKEKISEDMKESSPVVDPDNGVVIKSRQESLDKGKNSSAKERRFKELKPLQTFDVNSTKKAVWCMKFSPCGRFLATGGADCEVHVWCSKNYRDPEMSPEVSPKLETDALQGFCSEPFAIFKGHKNEILDLVWTEDFNLFSCSMDKDVKLWSLTTKSCLGTLRHDASVSSAKLLPKNRNFLATVSCEGILRLWDVPHRKVAGEIKVHNNLCTALEIIEDDSIIVVGTTDGKCLFFTKTLAAHATLSISEKKPKIFDICSFGDKMLVTTDDSKTRIYNNKTRQLLIKFNGAPHLNNLTRANFSPDSLYVLCGAEDYCLYFWSSNQPLPSQKNEQKQMEKIKIGKAAITVALFAPKPEFFIQQEENNPTDVIVCVDYNGVLTVLANTSAE